MMMETKNTIHLRGNSGEREEEEERKEGEIFLGLLPPGTYLGMI